MASATRGIALQVICEKLRTVLSMELAQEIHSATDEVVSASGLTLGDELNRFIGRFIRWPFKATGGVVRDRDGNQTEAFASVVHVEASGSGATDTEDFLADRVAAVVDACEELDLDKLRAAYSRIAAAKKLRKSPPPNLTGAAVTTVTLGIILGLRSALPLETLAEELEHLNAKRPGKEWADMIVVASTGAIQYAAQFPGEEVSGDWLPPAEDAVVAHTPPVYVVMIMRPTADYTLNKMISFLIAHLAVFLREQGCQLGMRFSRAFRRTR